MHNLFKYRHFTNPRKIHPCGQAILSQCYTRFSLLSAAPQSLPVRGENQYMKTCITNFYWITD